MSLTSSLSAWLTFTSSFNKSIRYSSSKGDPSLTVLFFLSFDLPPFLFYRLLFLEVSEIPDVEDLPELEEYCDSDIDEAPDMDIWSASN
jgi:hypothetical protein